MPPPPEPEAPPMSLPPPPLEAPPPPLEYSLGLEVAPPPPLPPPASGGAELPSHRLRRARVEGPMTEVPVRRARSEPPPLPPPPTGPELPSNRLRRATSEAWVAKAPPPPPKPFGDKNLAPPPPIVPSRLSGAAPAKPLEPPSMQEMTRARLGPPVAPLEAPPEELPPAAPPTLGPPPAGPVSARPFASPGSPPPGPLPSLGPPPEGPLAALEPPPEEPLTALEPPPEGPLAVLEPPPQGPLASPEGARAPGLAPPPGPALEPPPAWDPPEAEWTPELAHQLEPPPEWVEAMAALAPPPEWDDPDAELEASQADWALGEAAAELEPPPELEETESMLGAPVDDLVFAGVLELGAPAEFTEFEVDDEFAPPPPSYSWGYPLAAAPKPVPPARTPPPPPPVAPAPREPMLPADYRALANTAAEAFDSIPAEPSEVDDTGLRLTSDRSTHEKLREAFAVTAREQVDTADESLPPLPRHRELYVPRGKPKPGFEKPAPPPKPKVVRSFWKDTLLRLRSLLPGGQRPPRVPSEDLAVFTRQMAAMLGAGIPIHQVLSFYADSGEGDLGRVIDDVASRVAGGTRLSNALRYHPGVFSEVYAALVEAGETSSQILEILEKMAELLEKQVRMKKRILATITYPIILLCVSGLSIMGFIYFVLPMLLPLFANLKMQLPLPTRILLWSRHGIPVLTVGAILGAIVLWVCQPLIEAAIARSVPLQQRIDGFPLRLPLVGKTIEKVVVARVLYSLATMLEAGIVVIQALQRCAGVAGNAVVSARLRGAVDDLVGGMTVYEALSSHKVFPAGCLQLLCVGEESSSLSDTVRHSARFYEEEVEMALTDMASMLEPLIMVGMGLVVGFIVLSAVLPTVELINSL